MPTEELRQYVAALHLEDAIPEAAWPKIELSRYEPEEALATMGQTISHFSIMLEGRCRVSSSSEEGRMVVLGYLDPPAVNGDIELLNDCPSLHSVHAVGRVAALSIPRAVFFGEMMNHLPFVQMLCKGFAAKLYDTSSKHSRDMLYPLKSRLARHILARAPSATGVLPLDMEETSQYLGISPRHLRRVLAELEESKILVRAGGGVKVLDIAALRVQAALVLD